MLLKSKYLDNEETILSFCIMEENTGKECHRFYMSLHLSEISLNKEFEDVLQCNFRDQKL